MSRYAEIDADGIVLRVIECNSRTWLEQRLGGTWVDAEHASVGFQYNAESPTKFAPAWQEGKTYRTGDCVSHNSSIWKNQIDGNFCRPGACGWIEA